MNELFLQELNAITNYANSSNTDLTEQTVRDMLTNLLNMRQIQLYGNRCHPCENATAEEVKEDDEDDDEDDSFKDDIYDISYAR
jgi:hypothetical protein